uniref:phosphorylase kinase n=1 Tax=Vannella robusta TaxID=1487602 RepID=A0A7S4HNE9_9EUKA
MGLGEQKHHVGVDIEEFYVVGDILGKGAFSEVKLGTRKSDGKNFALKIMQKADEGDLKKAQIIKTEIEILKRVNHPHVVKMEEVFENDDKIILVLQIITGGELFEKIVEKTFYTEKDASKVIRQILEGLQALHKHKVVHRDLKPENLLLSTNDEDADVLITDFGLSAVLPEDGGLLHDAVGTPSYIAPEILIALDTPQGYSYEVDVWGVGVIMYILLCGFTPFYGDDEDEVYDKIEEGDYSFPSPYWDKISQEAQDLISQCFELDKNKRITIDEALKHPWICEHAPEVALDDTLKELAKFNARRKFKGAVKGLIAIQKFSKPPRRTIPRQ